MRSYFETLAEHVYLRLKNAKAGSSPDSFINY